MFYVEVLPALFFGAAVLFVPESPRYLVARARDARALDVLRRIDRHDDERRGRGHPAHRRGRPHAAPV